MRFAESSFHLVVISFTNISKMKIMRFCSGIAEDFVPLGFDAASLDSQIPTFQSNILALKCWDPITLVTKHHIEEEQNHYCHNGRLIDSHILDAQPHVSTLRYIFCCWSDSVAHPSFRN